MKKSKHPREEALGRKGMSSASTVSASGTRAGPVPWDSQKRKYSESSPRVCAWASVFISRGLTNGPRFHISGLLGDKSILGVARKEKRHLEVMFITFSILILSGQPEVQKKPTISS